MSLVADWFGWTDRGHTRSVNQDALIAPEVEVVATSSWSGGGHGVWGAMAGLWAVADGLGGHQDGERASGYALRLIRWQAERFWTGLRGLELRAAIGQSVREVHQKIADLGADQFLPMGTTLTGVWVGSTPGDAWVFHVGDTRLWQLCPGQSPILVTQDHNAGWGRADFQGKNIVESCLGGGMSDPRIDVLPLSYQSGDVWLLASDGLEAGLQTEQWQNLVRNPSDPESLVKALVSQAILTSEDNVTVLAIKWFN